MFTTKTDLDRALIAAFSILAAAIGGPAAGAAGPEGAPAGKIIGMYVHQHWPYNHPYAARTWTVEDWRGYADGLKRIGYNAVMIWPVLETMPDPLTPSDRANLEKIARVIDVLHGESGMRVWLALCPNVAADDREAAKAPFEKRHFFYCDARVDPRDPAAMRRMIEWRAKLLAPLAKADAVSIIDSDPGGYPGSTNADFVALLGEHRKMLDRLRPGIELVYWMHVGWQGYSRWYATGKFSWGTEEEQTDVLTRLEALGPEPWGLANGLGPARKLGLESRVISFNYGRIEGEPSFPLTIFGGDGAYKGGQEAGPRGLMGNAQTHCLQLPNTFAFARGATGSPLGLEDYVRFAGDLIPGRGPLIVRAWQATAGHDAAAMDAVAGELAALPDERLAPGPLKGLLFGSPRRFVDDLVLQLRLEAAFERFRAAIEGNREVAERFGAFVAAVETWQRRHGYENAWWWPEMFAALKKLRSPAIDAVLDSQLSIDSVPPAGWKGSGYEFGHRMLRETESYTVRLIAAMRRAADEMGPPAGRPAGGAGSPRPAASVRIHPPEGASAIAKRTAGILAARIREYSGARTVESGPADLDIRLRIEPGIGPEGFRIGDGPDGGIAITGNDGRGLLYGAGKLLHSSAFGDAGFTPGSWRGTSVPAKPVRGIYLATHFHNFYHEAPIEEVARYVEDCALWGMNAFLVWFGMEEFTGIDDPKARAQLDRLRALLGIVKGLGLDASLGCISNDGYKDGPAHLRADDSTVGHEGYHTKMGNRIYNLGNELCPSKPGVPEMELVYCREKFEAFQAIGLDYWFIAPYDNGGCTCPRCAPWGTNGYLRMAEPIARAYRRAFPGGKVVLSTWYFDRWAYGEWEGITERFNRNRPDWVDYIMADDYGGKYPPYPLEHGSPGGLPLLNFPEISMYRHYPWGGFGANPLPGYLQALWDATKGKLAGGFPYSEGIYEDLNKVICAQLYWDPDRPAARTVREYIAFCFSPAVVDGVGRAIEILERNLERTREDKDWVNNTSILILLIVLLVVQLFLSDRIEEQ